MNNIVIITPPAGNEDNNYRWLKLGEGRQHRIASGDLTRLKSDTEKHDRLLLFVDGSRVRLLCKKIPGRSKKQVQQAAPFALEDDIAEELESAQVVVGNENDSGYGLAVYSRPWLESVLKNFTDKGVRLAGVFSEALLVPHKHETISVVLTQTRALLRYGEVAGTAIGRQSVLNFLSRLIPAHESKRLELLSEPNAELSGQELEALYAIIAEPRVLMTTLPYPFIQWQGDKLRGSLNQIEKLNLLPSERENDKDQSGGRRWYQVAAALLISAAVAHSAISWVKIKRLEEHLAEITSVQTKVFRDAFPEVQRIVDVRAQSAQALVKLTSQTPATSNYMELFHDATKPLSDKETQIKLVGYTFADGTLLMKTESSDMQQLEKYSQLLNQQLVAEVVTAESVNDSVRGAVRVQSGQSLTP